MHILYIANEPKKNMNAHDACTDAHAWRWRGRVAAGGYVLRGCHCRVCSRGQGSDGGGEQ